jgi:virginiamycin B lyase
MTLRKSIPALVLVLTAVLSVPAVAGAAPPSGVDEFKLPTCEGSKLVPASPEGVLVPLCERRGERTIRSLGTLPPSGDLTKRPLPGEAAGPFAVGTGGEVWAGTGFSGANVGVDRIAADGTVTQIPLGTAKENNTLRIFGLVPGGDGSIWIAIGELAPEWYFHPYDSLGGELVHIAADGTVARFPVPEGIEPRALVRGPDGNLWFGGEKGRYATEHTSYLGKGYVGRMTPQGEFALFPTATEQSNPSGIAVGPDGRLWFTEASNWANEIGTIGTDGAFGPAIKVRNLVGPLAFDRQGNVWASLYGGVMRITAKGQHTLYPILETQDVVAGAEGDIWASEYGTVQRIVPGAPGIDAWKVEATGPSKTVHVQLACGGSEEGCSGVLTLSLTGKRGKEPGARLFRVRYSVAAESQRELKLRLTPKAVRLARGAVPKRAGRAYVGPVIVRATVAGGPTLDRRFYAPGLVTK